MIKRFLLDDFFPQDIVFFRWGPKSQTSAMRIYSPHVHPDSVPDPRSSAIFKITQGSHGFL